MLKALPETKTGNDRFEGWAIDLIFELSLLLGFEYEFILQEDKHYGKCINKATNEWDGMINKVMSGRADIAITDLTVTAERSRAIGICFMIYAFPEYVACLFLTFRLFFPLDFTPSVMNLGEIS